MHGKRVGIYVDTRRYRCHACRKTFYEVLPDINAKRLMTNRLVTWIGMQALRLPLPASQTTSGSSKAPSQLIFKDYVAELEQKSTFDTPTWMGLDEIYLILPHAVITNIRERTLVEILPNRNKDTVVHYLSTLKDAERVQVVTMDMWRPYQEAVQDGLPQETIVIDKFHVV